MSGPGEEPGPSTRLVHRDYDDPPSAWCTWWDAVTRVTDEIYYGWYQDEPLPWTWHWCTRVALWRAQSAGSHDLIARDPLHLEPSLHFTCCNLHGWIRDGRWQSA